MKDRIKKKSAVTLLSFFMLVIVSYPFLEVYRLKQVHPIFFLMMLAVICGLTLIIHNYLLRLPLFVLSYLFTLYYYFPLGQSFGFNWLQLFFKKNLLLCQQVLRNERNYLPDSIALIIILFLIITAAILLIHHERFGLSFFIFLGYLLMLSVINQLNLGIHVILIVSLAVLFYLLNHQVYEFHSFQKRKFVLLAISMLLIAIGSAYSLSFGFPKIKSVLFNHTTVIRKYANAMGVYHYIEQYGTDAPAKTGFSENDGNLGGPIHDDQTVLFTAKQKKEHYWRVETKNYYTSKGWKNASESILETPNQDLIISTNPELHDNLTSESKIILTFPNSVKYLPHPYGRSVIPWKNIGQTEKIEKKERINLISEPKKLQISWQNLAFTPTELQQVQIPTSQESDVNALFQLPPNLPSRVTELGISLTRSKKNLYDKVKAVEHHLKYSGEYRYSKTDTSFVPTEKDYVDYFLFESKTGYCDNFSSAMILLLRSVGITSRWAKGFSAGDLKAEGKKEFKEYVIKNSHAHSWPEVYFEGYGWIPFEPTPGFTNTDSPSELTKTISSTNEPKNSSTISSTTTETVKELTHSSSTTQPVDADTKTPRNIELRYIAVCLTLLILGIGGFFFKDYYFLLFFIIYRQLNPKRFANAYLKLLKQAEKLLTRDKMEPLTQYAQRLEKSYPQLQNHFIELTTLYEREIYGKKTGTQSDYADLFIKTAKIFTRIKKQKKQ